MPVIAGRLDRVVAITAAAVDIRYLQKTIAARRAADVDACSGPALRERLNPDSDAAAGRDVHPGEEAVVGAAATIPPPPARDEPLWPTPRGVTGRHDPRPAAIRRAQRGRS